MLQIVRMCPAYSSMRREHGDTLYIHGFEHRHLYGFGKSPFCLR